MMLETTVTGSLPKPSWLADPEKLWARWRLEDEELRRGKEDAALVWLKEQEAAGVDIVSDGEQFRIHFVHGFLEHLGGIDWNLKTSMGIRDNRYVVDVTTVTGPLHREGPADTTEARFVRDHTERKLKFCPARAHDNLRYHRRCSLWAPRRHGDGLRSTSQRRSQRVGGNRR